jgi:hypothetical protein
MLYCGPDTIYIYIYIYIYTHTFVVTECTRQEIHCIPVVTSVKFKFSEVGGGSVVGLVADVSKGSENNKVQGK